MKRETISRALRARVHAKYDGHCAYCGTAIAVNEMHADHIEPCQRYGMTDFENLNPACRPCNNFKGIWLLEEFRRELSKQIERCRKYSVNFRNAERFGLVTVNEPRIVFYFERIRAPLAEVASPATLPPTEILAAPETSYAAIRNMLTGEP